MRSTQDARKRAQELCWRRVINRRPCSRKIHPDWLLSPILQVLLCRYVSLAFCFFRNPDDKNPVLGLQFHWKTKCKTRRRSGRRKKTACTSDSRRIIRAGSGILWNSVFSSTAVGNGSDPTDVSPFWPILSRRMSTETWSKIHTNNGGPDTFKWDRLNPHHLHSLLYLFRFSCIEKHKVN